MSTKNNTALVLRLYQEFDKGALDGFAESIDSEFVANVLDTSYIVRFWLAARDVFSGSWELRSAQARTRQASPKIPPALPP